MGLIDKLLGRPLADDEEEDNRVGVGAGIPMLGLDALSSCAYGPEAALTLLIPLGVLGLNYIGPIIGVILVLLGILYLSYRQTISAYPNGGGSYTVAKENLGTTAGLVAAAALLLDYILNVAVGISAGVGALVSALPNLQPHMLALCLWTLVLVTVVNLRGIKESGLAFALPTYLFIATLGVVLGLGIYQVLVSGGSPTPVERPPALPTATTVVSWWLLMRAFASGCTAMTGVEAVSNGVSAFREPGVGNAQRTLTIIITLLALLLVGIAWLSYAYHIGATDPTSSSYQSVISMLVAAVVGRTWFYYLTIGSVLCVLALSANTSFAGFPRLCNLLAQDHYLPHSLANRGRRLVFSVGIVGLATLAGILLVIFGGITDRLIPLFAIGAFGAFTLSQSGMVVHWLRHPGPQARLSLVINATGAVATGAALVVVLAAKLLDGAWITLLIMPIAMWAFQKSRQHYRTVEEEIASPHPIHLEDLEAPVVVIPIKGWSSITEKALRFALRISETVICVYVQMGDHDVTGLQSDWNRYVEAPMLELGKSPPPLVILPSPYRHLLRPMRTFIRETLDEYPTRAIAVIIPELAETRWYEYLMHNQRATWLKAALLMWGHQRVAVINVPWFLHELPEHEEVHAAKLSALLAEG